MVAVPTSRENTLLPQAGVTHYRKRITHNKAKLKTPNSRLQVSMIPISFSVGVEVFSYIFCKVQPNKGTHLNQLQRHSVNMSIAPC